MYYCYNDYTNQQDFNINVILVTLRRSLSVINEVNVNM